MRSASIRIGTTSISCVNRDTTLWPKTSTIGLVWLHVGKTSFVSLTSVVVSKLCSDTWNPHFIWKCSYLCYRSDSSSQSGIGDLIRAACIEIQAIMEKTGADPRWRRSRFLQQENRHPNEDDDDYGDRVFDEPGEAEPCLTMPLEFGIDRRHTFLIS